MARAPHLHLKVAGLGAEGLALARAEQLDLILLDLHLPDMPGREILRQLRNDSARLAVPIVVVTADVSPVLRASVMADGACDVLIKPLDPRALLAVFQNHLKHDDA